MAQSSVSHPSEIPYKC